MSVIETYERSEVNRRRLTSALAAVRTTLERYISRNESPASEEVQGDTDSDWTEERSPSSIDTICATFGLSPFERDLLLLCAAPELDSSFGDLFAAAHGDPRRRQPTFSLALAAFANAHWSALTPAGPLRRWRMIEVSGESSLTTAPLRIDETILHYLAGTPHIDERLNGYLTHIAPPVDPAPSHRRIAERIADLWNGSRNDASELPLMALCGSEDSSLRAVAATAAASVGLSLYGISAHDLPHSPTELDTLARLWERQAALGALALMIECHDVDPAEAVLDRTIIRMGEGTGGAVMTAGRGRRAFRSRQVFTFDVEKPTAQEQRKIWTETLGEAFPGMNGTVDRIISQFNMDAGGIRAVGDKLLAAEGNGSETEYGAAVWDACRDHSRPRLDELARRIVPSADWEDLVLPERQRETLRQIAAHVRSRTKVYQQWGFAGKGNRGLGISALFAGPSGTGKTMAAEVLARQLHLDLYRIDLSSIISKYIGETEKNLRRVFDAAEESGVILLFDEADALFGKRSEVKDSHDRYANIEVSYLLQRMEAYRGLAILTTNLKNALDTAFLRRLRFVLEFPFPDTGARAEIWRRVFPAETPTEGLDVAKLARLNVAGGNIRNIALNGAFLAADAGEPVRMEHLAAAARSEYVKLEKPLTEL